jgi:hypothetical protein
LLDDEALALRSEVSRQQELTGIRRSAP